MATKRLRDDFQDEANGFNGAGKRARISFAAVIRDAMVAKQLQNLVVTLEPTLRRVIQEEVDKALRKVFNSLNLQPGGPQLAAAAANRQAAHPHSLQVIEADSDGAATSPPARSTLRLAFTSQPPKKIFTNMKIDDGDGAPLQLGLLGDAASDAHLLRALPPSLKIELFLVDGDFPAPGNDDWTAEEFARSVLKERVGRRPLLTGDVNNVVMRDRKPVDLEDVVITDNSSWIRCRKFRIGARVAPECCEAAGVRIKEALTEPFVVKDHRGELYKKSYPPALSDDVWRLEKIGKDGKFHRRLADNDIKSVQDFLKLHAVDQTRLRTILGQGMSDRMWDSTVNHAKTCDLGNKLYFHRDPHSDAAVLLNPICGVEAAVVGGVRFAAGDPFYGPHGAYVNRLVADAYARWGDLQELDRAAALVPQDPMHVLFQQPLMLPGASIADNSPPAALQGDVIVTTPLNAGAMFDFDITLADAVHLDFGGTSAGAAAAFFQFPTPYQTPLLQQQQPGNLYSTHEQLSDEEGSSVSQQGYFQSS